MKTRLIFAALAIAAMASCTVESLDTKVFHATLGGGDTRTSLQQDGSVAHVLWEAGDAITVFALLPNGAFYHNDFTTSDSGTASADFACHSWNPNNSNIEGYYAFYPASKFKSITYDAKNGAYVGVSIPPVQTAVKDGVDPDLLFAFAKQDDSMAGDLHFQNMLFIR